MKIAVVGPGAIGLLIAALLSKTKEDVWLLDKDAQRAARIRKSGITVKGLTSIATDSVKITSNPSDLKDTQLWIICVKSYDTKVVIKNISGNVDDSAFFLSLQNGIGNIELLSEAFGSNRVLLGITNMGSILLEDGVVKHTGDGETVVGALDGKITVITRDLRSIFQKAKIDVRFSKDIKSILWSKLVLNSGINALSAITRLKNGRLIQFEWTRRVLADAINEAVKVAKRKRIKLIYDDVIAKAESVCEATSGNISSMLQDVLRKKRTEIDFLNGAVLRQADSLGIKTPVNAALVDLIKTIESTYVHEVKNLAS